MNARHFGPVVMTPPYSRSRKTKHLSMQRNNDVLGLAQRACTIEVNANLVCSMYVYLYFINQLCQCSCVPTQCANVVAPSAHPTNALHSPSTFSIERYIHTPIHLHVCTHLRNSCMTRSCSLLIRRLLPFTQLTTYVYVPINLKFQTSTTT